MFAEGDEVEVHQLSGWKPGRVASVEKLPGTGTVLYRVHAPGEHYPRRYRADQVRVPEPCAGCVRLEAENKDLKARLELVLGELRKWVDTG